MANKPIIETQKRRDRDATNRRIADLVERQHGVIARWQLLACGLSSGAVDARVRRARLFPVVRGVHALSPYVSTWGHRHAAVLAVRAGGRRGDGAAGGGRDGTAGRRRDGPRDGTAETIGPVLSHWSAAQAHGLLPTTDHRHHVTVSGTGDRRAAAVRIHRARALLPGETSVIEGLRVTNPARTILDCAVGASVQQIRKLIREAEYQRLIGTGDLAATVGRRPSHPGSPIVRMADPQTAESCLAQTPLEDEMTALLAELPLPPPLPQHAVVGASGRQYRADFAWDGLRLIVETDGRAAHDRSSSFDSDRERDADLAAAGWLTLRVTRLQLRDGPRVGQAIVATARSRGLA